ncbi:MAG TPA: heparan-alpha-glucosaminide N-acetyltransferase domain-containing protein, partial [Gemmatimonadales bacterium]|nr:heparan-alpha-glucosaminide N-acetyltransferase domain-containing protein [Gemmatimonadales bacterium]
MTVSAAPPAPAVGLPAQAPSQRTRLDALDLMRGLVMVIMALDHVRDFFHHDALIYDPTDLTQTTPAVFLTRWITHLCAPAFVFLAGMGAYLYGTRGRSRTEVARFLVTRGLWLVVVELTLVRFALFFNFDYNFMFLQVIWAIGWSMVLLAGLIFLPQRVLLVLAVLVIAGHNLLDGIGPAPFSSFADGAPPLTAGDWIWSVIHVPNPPIIYPLVPWFAVMALGYTLGAVARM